MDEREKLMKLWDEGASLEEMAQSLHTSTYTVRLRLQEILGKPLPKRAQRKRPEKVWTAVEDRRLGEMYDDELKWPEIAGRVNATVDEARARLLLLRGWEKFPPRIGIRGSKIKCLGGPASVLGAASACRLAKLRALRATYKEER